MTPERRFPIMLPSRKYNEPKLEPLSLPWSLMAPHDEQCQRNHGGQTLARIAERGGLSPTEALAVLADQPYPWRQMCEGQLPPIEEELERLRLIGALWEGKR